MSPIALFQILDGMIFLAAALLLSVWWTNCSLMLKWWSGAYLIGGGGLALLIWSGWQPVWLAYGPGTTLVLLAYGMAWLGLRTQSTQPKSRWWWLILPALLWLLISPLPQLQDNGLLRMVVFSPIAALCMGTIAWEALRLPGKPAARWPLASVSLIHGVFYLIRTLSLAMHEGTTVGEVWFYATAIEGIAFVFSDAFLVMSLARAQREDALETEARHDFLTGVLNRRGFVLLAEERLRRPPFSLLILDADRFKSVNDQLGHATGDEILRQLARSCLDAVSPSDLVGRLGGDEFAVLVSGPAEAGLGSAQRIRSDFHEKARAHGVSVSIGFVHCKAGDERSLALLLDAADRDLYEDKARRNVALS